MLEIYHQKGLDKYSHRWYSDCNKEVKEMTIEIIELTDSQIKGIKAKFPLSEPKRFRVKEGKGTLDYCDTKEQAERAVKQWDAREDLSLDISNFQDEMVEKYSGLLDEEEIKQEIKG